jgi:hypothetical protein
VGADGARIQRIGTLGRNRRLFWQAEPERLAVVLAERVGKELSIHRIQNLLSPDRPAYYTVAGKQKSPECELAVA